jgi:hypothetical protein
MFRFTVCVALAAFAAGCGPEGGPKKGKDGGPAGDGSALAEGKKLLLASEPAGVKGVIAVRKEAKDGDEVAVAGSVGGAAKPFTEGRASFLVVDPSLKPEPEAEGECQWDFCHLEKKELDAAKLLVKFVDAKGGTLKAGAKEMFGLKELRQVVVTGKVSRDDKGNVTVVGTGIFVRPEAK